MIVLDTSALIRFFTNDIASKAQIVKRTLESEKVFIPEVVFPELEYVLLGKTYNASRVDIVKALQYLANKKNVKTSKEVAIAIQIYSDSSFDMADSIVISHSLKHKLLSFDKKMKQAAIKLAKLKM